MLAVPFPTSDQRVWVRAARRPGGLIVTDLGVREGEIAPGVPTVIVDHHVPTGKPGEAVVISGNGQEPEPTSALLAYWCVQGLGEADDLVWLAGRDPRT